MPVQPRPWSERTSLSFPVRIDAGTRYAGLAALAAPLGCPAMAEAPFLHATRTSYDTIAVHHPDRLGTADLNGRPLERALLGVFAEWVRAAGNGPVADVGCGAGGMTKGLGGPGFGAVGGGPLPGVGGPGPPGDPGLRVQGGFTRGL